MRFFAPLLTTLALNTVLGAPLEDLVEYLPDFGRPPTPHFSGYLNATEGCNTAKNGECYLHYWLAMAEEDPLEKPVVLWLNGGPGSSSILGFLQENGPLLINATGGLHKNPYAWTKVANLIALEAPVGVGYSFCSKQLLGDTCENTDKYTASASRAGLVDFFKKFPELKKNDFFITGESYAGVYIPTLTKEILDNTDLNIKGIAVGDPCTDNKAQADSMDELWYAYKYGLVDEDLYNLLWYKCDARSPNFMTRGGLHLAIKELNEELKLKRSLLRRDPKDIAEEVLKRVKGPGPNFKDTAECSMAFRKFMLSSSHGLSQGWSDLYIDDYSLFAPVTDKEDDDMAAYMMRPDVRKALHVEKAPTKTWPYSDVGFDYTKEFDACNWDEGEITDKRSMIDFYRDIVPRLSKTFVYNGDTDPCVSYEGTRAAIKQVGFKELDGGGYRPWFYNKTASSLELLAEKAPLFGPDLGVQELGAQMGGEVVDYEHNLSFVLVHGSGHMVPQFRPQAALQMLIKLIKFEPLSPLMPSNKTLAEMSDEQFAKALDDWTEEAMACPFVI